MSPIARAEKAAATTNPKRKISFHSCSLTPHSLLIHYSFTTHSLLPRHDSLTHYSLTTLLTLQNEHTDVQSATPRRKLSSKQVQRRLPCRYIHLLIQKFTSFIHGGGSTRTIVNPALGTTRVCVMMRRGSVSFIGLRFLYSSNFISCARNLPGDDGACPFLGRRAWRSSKRSKWSPRRMQSCGERDRMHCQRAQQLS